MNFYSGVLLLTTLYCACVSGLARKFTPAEVKTIRKAQDAGIPYRNFDKYNRAMPTTPSPRRPVMSREDAMSLRKESKGGTEIVSLVEPSHVNGKGTALSNGSPSNNSQKGPLPVVSSPTDPTSNSSSKTTKGGHTYDGATSNYPGSGPGNYREGQSNNHSPDARYRGNSQPEYHYYYDSSGYYDQGPYHGNEIYHAPEKRPKNGQDPYRRPPPPPPRAMSARRDPSYRYHDRSTYSEPPVRPAETGRYYPPTDTPPSPSGRYYLRNNRHYPEPSRYYLGPERPPPQDRGYYSRPDVGPTSGSYYSGREGPPRTTGRTGYPRQQGPSPGNQNFRNTVRNRPRERSPDNSPSGSGGYNPDPNSGPNRSPDRGAYHSGPERARPDPTGYHSSPDPSRQPIRRNRFYPTRGERFGGRDGRRPKRGRWRGAAPHYDHYNNVNYGNRNRRINRHRPQPPPPPPPRPTPTPNPTPPGLILRLIEDIF